MHSHSHIHTYIHTYILHTYTHTHTHKEYFNSLISNHYKIIYFTTHYSLLNFYDSLLMKVSVYLLCYLKVNVYILRFHSSLEINVNQANNIFIIHHYHSDFHSSLEINVNKAKNIFIIHHYHSASPV